MVAPRGAQQEMNMAQAAYQEAKLRYLTSLLDGRQKGGKLGGKGKDSQGGSRQGQRPKERKRKGEMRQEQGAPARTHTRTHSLTLSSARYRLSDALHVSTVRVFECSWLQAPKTLLKFATHPVGSGSDTHKERTCFSSSNA